MRSSFPCSVGGRRRSTTSPPRLTSRTKKCFLWKQRPPFVTIIRTLPSVRPSADAPHAHRRGSCHDQERHCRGAHRHPGHGPAQPTPGTRHRRQGRRLCTTCAMKSSKNSSTSARSRTKSYSKPRGSTKCSTPSVATTTICCQTTRDV